MAKRKQDMIVTEPIKMTYGFVVGCLMRFQKYDQIGLPSATWLVEASRKEVGRSFKAPLTMEQAEHALANLDEVFEVAHD